MPEAYYFLFPPGSDFKFFLVFFTLAENEFHAWALLLFSASLAFCLCALFSACTWFSLVTVV